MIDIVNNCSPRFGGLSLGAFIKSNWLNRNAQLFDREIHCRFVQAIYHTSFAVRSAITFTATAELLAVLWDICIITNG